MKLPCIVGIGLLLLSNSPAFAKKPPKKAIEAGIVHGLMTPNAVLPNEKEFIWIDKTKGTIEYVVMELDRGAYRRALQGVSKEGISKLSKNIVILPVGSEGKQKYEFDISPSANGAVVTISDKLVSQSPWIDTSSSTLAYKKTEATSHFLLGGGLDKKPAPVTPKRLAVAKAPTVKSLKKAKTKEPNKRAVDTFQAEVIWLDKSRSTVEYTVLLFENGVYKTPINKLITEKPVSVPQTTIVMPIDSQGKRRFTTWITQTKKGKYFNVGKKIESNSPVFQGSRKVWGIDERQTVQMTRQGKPKEAEFILSTFVGGKKADDETHFKLGSVQYFSGKRSEAKKSFQIARRAEKYRIKSDYYLGLIAFDESNSTDAKEYLTRVASSNDKFLQPSAHYYLGKLAFNNNEYQVASQQFAVVRDTASTQTARDDAAEMLVAIERKGNYNERKANPFSGGIKLDLAQYDSNVASIPVNAETVTNRGGLVFGGSADLKYQFTNDDGFEGAGTYNLNANHHSDNGFANNDQWSHTLSVPLLFKDKVEGEPRRLSLTPAVTSSFSNLDGIQRAHPNREVSRSYQLNTKASYAHGKTKMWEFGLGGRWDDSRVAPSSADDDSTGAGVTASAMLMQFANSQRTEGVNAGLNVDWAIGRGKNVQHAKPGVSVAYFRPLFWQFTGNLGLSANRDVYYSHVNGRRDFQLKGDLTLSRELASQFGYEQLFSVTRNFSNIDNNQYVRFLTTASLKYTF